jgi:hypothetical protein
MSPGRARRWACRRSCRSMITPWRSAPLAGKAARRCRSARPACTGWPGRRQHGACGRPSGRRQVDAVDVTGGDAALDAPAQACGRDAAVAAAGCLQQLRHRTGRARRAQRLPANACGAKVCSASSSSAPAATCAARKASLAEAAVPKKRIDRLTEPTGTTRPRVSCGAAEDQLGRAAADVDHQPRLVGRLQKGHAGIDQAGFLAARDHLDRESPAPPRRAAGRRCGCAPRAASASPPRAPARWCIAVQPRAKRRRQARPRSAASSVSSPLASSPPPRRTVSFR